MKKVYLLVLLILALYQPVFAQVPIPGGPTGPADDADFTAGTTPGAPVMGVYQSSPRSITDEDMGIIGVTETGAVRTAVEGNVGLSVQKTVDDVAGTTGVPVLAVRDDATTTLTEADGDETRIRTNARGAAWVSLETALDPTIDGVHVGATATVTNAAVPCYITSAASTNATNCKASAGNVYLIRAINTTSTIYFLRMYDLASAPTCSSATGFVETIPVPHGTGAGGGLVSPIQVGQAYSTGIGFCLTGGGSSTDNTNAATGVYLTILYK